MERHIHIGSKSFTAEELSDVLIRNCSVPTSTKPQLESYLRNISGETLEASRARVGLIQQAKKDWELKLCRLLVFAVAAIFATVTQALLETRVMQKDVIIDYPLKWTDPINKFFWQHKNFTNGYIILCSLFMDFFAIVLPCLIIFGKDKHPNRIVLSFSLFFVLRQFFQTLIVLPTPKDYLWYYPGFPSLVVPYNPANDFYFSGHIGFLTVVSRELAKRKLWPLFGGCMVAVFLNSMMVIITRTHYTIDVIDAVIVAWFTVDVAEKLSSKVDDWFKKILGIFFPKTEGKKQE